MKITKLVVSSVAVIGLGGLVSQAFAMPHHESVKTAGPNADAPCVYPDGTTASGEIHCYTPDQFMKAYGIDKLHAMGITGKGQVVIVADSFGSPTAQADLDKFSDTFGLPRTTIEFIYPDGPYTNTMTDDLPDEEQGDHAGWAGETTLDLEWAHAVAPDAKIVNIVTNSSESVGMAGMADLFKGIQMATQKYPGAIISMSFGTGESTFTADEQKTQLQGALHQILQDATNAGITLLASTGDNGTVNETENQKSMYPFPDAGYPATDPLITAVGGTALEYGWRWTPEGTADDYWNCVLALHEKKITACPTDFLASTIDNGDPIESVWKEDWAVAAGAGGVSKVFAAPEYQAGVNAGAQSYMKGYRGVPDISFNAAINGGVDVYMSASSPGQPNTAPWQSYGGTSCASPEMAGLIALAGQVASAQAGRPLSIGQLNPLLYTLNSADFNDIVTQTFGASKQISIGDDSLYFSTNKTIQEMVGPTKMAPVQVMGYPTTPGYDLATGLGTPKAVGFVLDLAKARIAKESPVSSEILSSN